MKKFRKTSVAGSILEEFLKPQFKYKGMSVNMFGLPSFRAKCSKSTFSNEFSRLKRENFIEKTANIYELLKRDKNM